MSQMSTEEEKEALSEGGRDLGIPRIGQVICAGNVEGRNHLDGGRTEGGHEVKPSTAVSMRTQSSSCVEERST